VVVVSLRWLSGSWLLVHILTLNVVRDLGNSGEGGSVSVGNDAMLGGSVLVEILLRHLR